MDVYQQLAAERLHDPLAHRAGPPAGGRDDHLVTRTWNGLRPADAVLDQPPQDPEWRPDDDR